MSKKIHNEDKNILHSMLNVVNIDWALVRGCGWRCTKIIEFGPFEPTCVANAYKSVVSIALMWFQVIFMGGH